MSGSPPAASADKVANTPANKKRKLNKDKVVSLANVSPDDDNVSRLYQLEVTGAAMDDSDDR
jgi:hypothetical protein